MTRQLIAETMWGAVDANGSWVYREGPSFVPSAGNDDLVSFSAFIDERGGGKEARRAAKRSFAKDYGYEHHGTPERLMGWVRCGRQKNAGQTPTPFPAFFR